MKCDTCHLKSGYTLGEDECGAGSLFEYCSKGHWDGAGPRSEEEEKRCKSLSDPWFDCSDYRKAL